MSADAHEREIEAVERLLREFHVDYIRCETYLQRQDAIRRHAERIVGKVCK